jgi:hypothetical protein
LIQVNVLIIRSGLRPGFRVEAFNQAKKWEKKTMKSTCALLLFVCASAVPYAPAQAPARTDVYHVHFAKATLRKGAEEGDFLKQQSPDAPMKGHHLVLRHQSGEDWDYAVIEHLGTSATVKAAGTPAPASARDLNAWHTDTFVNGPAWPEFAKAIGLDDQERARDRFTSSPCFGLRLGTAMIWRKAFLRVRVERAEMYCSSISKVALGSF